MQARADENDEESNEKPRCSIYGALRFFLFSCLLFTPQAGAIFALKRGEKHFENAPDGCKTLEGGWVGNLVCDRSNPLYRCDLGDNVDAAVSLRNTHKYEFDLYDCKDRENWNGSLAFEKAGVLTSIYKFAKGICRGDDPDNYEVLYRGADFEGWVGVSSVNKTTVKVDLLRIGRNANYFGFFRRAPTQETDRDEPINTLSP